MAGSNIMGAANNTGNIISPLFWGHNGEWWDAVLIVALVLTFFAAGAVALSTVGSIFAHKHEAQAAEQSLEIFKAETARVAIETSGRVADARKAGLEAGERAGHAQTAVDAAEVEIAKQKTLTKQAELSRMELQRDIAPRDLSDRQLLSLADALKGNVGKLFVVGRDEDEPRQLTQQVCGALRKAGLLDDYVTTISPVDQWVGFRLYVPNANTREDAFNDPLVQAFMKAKIPFETYTWGADANGVTTSSGTIRKERTIFIGSKPLKGGYPSAILFNFKPGAGGFKVQAATGITKYD